MLAEFMSSRIGENIFYASIIFVILLFPLLRGIVQKRLDNVSDFNPDLIIIGVSSGIMFNFEKKMFVFTSWFQRRPAVCHYSDIAKDVNGSLILEETCIDKVFGPHIIEIFTDILDQPIVKISFWTKRQAARCNSGLRKFREEHQKNKLLDETKTKQKFHSALKIQISKQGQVGKSVSRNELDGYIDFLLLYIQIICGRKH